MRGRAVGVPIRTLVLLAAVVLVVRFAGAGGVSGQTANAVAAGKGDVPAGLAPATWSRIQAQLPVPVQEAKLTADDAESNDRFGFDVAVDGDIVVVGAPFEGALYHTGAAYVFARNEGGANQWGQVAKLTAGDAGGYDELGWSVAVSGDTVAVGAPHENGGPGDPFPDAGAVYIFARDQGGPGNWGQVVKLMASDPEEEDDFGLVTSLDGDTLVVGAPGEDGGPGNPMPYAGAAYIFERDQGGPNAWGEVTKLAASDAESGDGFAGSVVLDEDTLVVGASQEDGAVGWAGAAYVFERDHGGSDNWGEVTKLAASDAGNNDRFGTSAALAGDTLVVGAPFEDGGPGDPLFVAGAAYVFERNQGGPNQWGEVTKLAAGDPDTGDFFGMGLAVFGDIIVAGAPDESGGPGDPILYAGATYIFARDEGGPDNWGQVAKLTSDDIQAGDRFGGAVAASSDGVILVGASDEDGGPGDPMLYAGAAYVMCLDDDLEENDDFAAAAALAAGSYPGLQICRDDDDYFSLALAAGDTLHLDIFFSHAIGNLDLALYDADHNLLAVSDSQTDEEHISYEAAAAGVYFVHVYGYQGARAGYALLVGVTAEEADHALYLPMITGP